MSLISRIAFGAVATVLLGSGAMAADLMAPPPADVAMTSDWTGGYIGVGGAYSNYPSIAATVVQLDGILGADFQTGMFLVGVQGWVGYAYSPSDNSASWDYGAEGRLGIVAGDNVAIYGSAGEQSYTNGGENYWTLGIGAEFMVSDNVGLDFEYKHFWPGSGAITSVDEIEGALLWHFK